MLEAARTETGSTVAGVPAPEEQLEPALRTLVGEAGAVAGAVCLWEPADATLHLAAEIGLSDGGCRLLRTLGPAGGWDPPLACVRDERPYVVADAPALAGAAAGTAVACLPLGAGAAPRGCIVLVGDGAARFDDARLDALAPALAALEDVVEAIHHAAAVAAAPATRIEQLAEAALEAIGPIAREVTRLLRGAGALPGVAGATRLLGRLAPDAGRAVVPAPVLEAEYRRLEERVGAREAEAARRLAGREAELAAARQHLRALTEERDRLAIQADETAGREAAARAEVAAARQRAAAERDESRRRAQEIAAAAERERAAATAEAERARAALARADAALVAAREDARAACAELARLAATAEATRVAGEQARVALAEARAREAAALARAQATDEELAALRREARQVEAEAAALDARWQARLAETERAAGGDRQALEALRREHGALVDELAETAAREARARDELAALQRRYAADRDGVLERARALARDTEAARAAAVAELESVRDELAETQALVVHLQEKHGLTADAAAARDETLRYALEFQQQSDEGRAAALAETEAVRAALANAQTTILDAEDAARTAEAEAARFQAAAATAESERAHAVAGAEQAQRREADAIARAEGLEREVWELREATRRLELQAHEQMASARAAVDDALARAEAEATRERLRREDAERSTAQAEAALAESRGRERHASETLAAFREQAAAERDAAVRQALALGEEAERARAAAAAEAEALRTALGDVQIRILAIEDEAQAARAEAERLAAEEARARADLERATAALAESRARETDAAAGLAAATAELAVLRAAAAPRPATTAGARAVAAPRAATPAGGHTTLAVVDDGDGWAAAARADTAITVLAPDGALGERLRALAPDALLANLATPGVFDALLALRAGGCPTPFHGCVTVPGRDGVLVLGAIEPARRPLDAETLLALLAARGARGSRVLVVGAEASAMIGLRQALVRDGRAVSIAWDTKQATELLGMVRPDIAVVDLGVPPRGGHALLGELATLTPAPLVVTLARETDPAAAFAAACDDPQRRGGLVAPARAVALTIRPADAGQMTPAAASAARSSADSPSSPP
jgi:hypothetical protein